MTVGLIVAMTRERLIGRDNALPWHHPEDLRHFKRTTVGHPVVMGRRSLQSLGRPLPGRTHVIVSRSVAAGAGPDGVLRDGLVHVGSLPAAFAWIAFRRPEGHELVWVLGGGQIYRQILAPFDDGPGGHERAGLPRPDRLSVTWVPSVPVCDDDVLFPYDEAWIARHFEVASRRESEDGELEFVEYRLPDGG